MRAEKSAKTRVHFNHFLSAYFPDPDYGGKRLFDDMLKQARAADRLGCRGITIPEHHLVNIAVPRGLRRRDAADAKDKLTLAHDPYK
jgi:alkanesulfonate monooxygenase SsuD/methylene tetrahydromethanopterin reductase-like flavin-dependent oxidoreductase (luciferase family)